MIWQDRAVLPAPSFTIRRLLALLDADGFVLALGYVLGTGASTVTVRAPLASGDQVDALRLGDIALDTQNYSEKPI